MGSVELYLRLPILPKALINFNASGDTILIPSSSNQRVNIYSVWLIVEGATVLTFKDDLIALSGPISLSAHQELMLPLRGEPWFTTDIETSFIVNSSNAVQIGGILSYQAFDFILGYSAIILRDSNGVRWSVTILPAGNLDTEVLPFGPIGSLEISPLILQASDVLLWQVSISTSGNLITTPVAAAVAPYLSIQLGKKTLTVSTSGNLVTV